MPVTDPDRKVVSFYTTDDSDERPTFNMTQEDVDRLDEIAEDWGTTRSELMRAAILAGLHKLGVDADNSADESAQGISDGDIEGEIIDMLRQNPGLPPDEIESELSEHIESRTGDILDELSNEKQLIEFSAAEGGYVIN